MVAAVASGCSVDDEVASGSLVASVVASLKVDAGSPVAFVAVTSGALMAFVAASLKDDAAPPVASAAVDPDAAMTYQ